VEAEAEYREDAALRRSLALDADELAFLRSATLPARLAALVRAQPNPRAQLIALLWIAVPAAIGYAAWLTVAPLFGGAIELVTQTGGSALAASLVAGALWGTLDALASIIELLSAVPGFSTPLLTLSLIAVALYALALLTPPRPVRHGALAV
jgi:hypothetical protein